LTRTTILLSDPIGALPSVGGKAIALWWNGKVRRPLNGQRNRKPRKKQRWRPRKNMDKDKVQKAIEHVKDIVQQYKDSRLV